MLIGLRKWIRKYQKFRSLCFDSYRVHQRHKLLPQRFSSKLSVAYLQAHVLCAYTWVFILPHFENIIHKDFALWVYLTALYLITTTYLPVCCDLSIQGCVTHVWSGVILADWAPDKSTQSMLSNTIRRVTHEGWWWWHSPGGQHKGSVCIRDVTGGSRKTHQTFVTVLHCLFCFPPYFILRTTWVIYLKWRVPSTDLII